MTFAIKSIRTKILILAMLVSMATVLLVVLAYGYLGAQQSRAALAEQQQSIAGVLAGNLAAPILFGDSEAAARSLASLRADAQIIAARVLLPNNEVFATYERLKGGSDTWQSQSYNSGLVFFDDDAEILVSVEFDNDLLGFLQIKTSLSRIQEERTTLLVISFLVMVGGLIVAFGLSGLLRNIIARPIEGLVEAMDRVSTERNFSVRVEKTTNDELGSLIDGFNLMLSRIDAQHNEITGYRNHLENLVAERTKDLYETNEQLRSLASNIPGGLFCWSVNADGTVDQVYGAGQLVTDEHLIVSEGARQSVATIWPGLHPADGVRLADDMRQAQLQDGRVSTEVRVSVTEDDVRWIKVLGHIRHGVGGQKYCDLIALDITEAQRREEQLRLVQKMDALGALTGGIAHDFNNIVSIIMANLELLIDRVADIPDANSYAEAALTASERGAEMTQRLLTFARRQTSSRAVLDSNERIASFVQLLHRTLGAEIEIGLELQDDLWSVHCDLGELEAAVMNLAVNARDAMEGRGNIVISTRNVTRRGKEDDLAPNVLPGDFVMIAVTDSGGGMTAEVLRRAFEPLFTTKSVGKGTGFGLAMVYGFTTQAGGYTAIESELGTGTTVRLYLPRHDGVPELSPEVVAEQREQAPGERNHILLVDDNNEARIAYAMQLRNAGYRVDEGDNAQAAIDFLESDATVDLVVTDVIMPGELNGADLAYLVQQRCPQIAVIVISGYPDEALLKQRKLLDDFTILRKPLRKRDLLKEVWSKLEAPASNSGLPT